MPSATIGTIAAYIEELAPPAWAESWDNVGLQAGDPARPAERILVALELTGGVVEEAVAARASLIIVHHPTIFKPWKALRFDTSAGRRVERLIQAGIGLYAAHTNLDQAKGGTNDTLAAAAGLTAYEVLFKVGDDLYPLANPGPERGHGRIGRLSAPITLADLVDHMKGALQLAGARVVGDLQKRIETVAVGAGSGGMLIPYAARRGADVLITGDVDYHEALDAADSGLAVIDVGHYYSEVIVVPPLAAYLRQRLAADGLAAAVIEAQAGRDPFHFC